LHRETRWVGSRYFAKSESLFQSFLKNTPALQRIIMEEGNSIEIAEQARKEGFNDLRTSGLLKAMQGITSLEEVNRVTKD
ncbi:hypothetical protein FA137_27685, partial [Pseudomonas aeruginosa]|nr:hypothetical protein [Pseudomonas aeruginosa]